MSPSTIPEIRCRTAERRQFRFSDGARTICACGPRSREGAGLFRACACHGARLSPAAPRSSSRAVIACLEDGKSLADRSRILLARGLAPIRSVPEGDLISDHDAHLIMRLRMASESPFCKAAFKPRSGLREEFAPVPSLLRSSANRVLIEGGANWYGRCLIEKNAHLAPRLVVYRDCERQTQ